MSSPQIVDKCSCGWPLTTWSKKVGWYWCRQCDERKK